MAKSRLTQSQPVSWLCPTPDTLSLQVDLTEKNPVPLVVRPCTPMRPL